MTVRDGVVVRVDVTDARYSSRLGIRVGTTESELRTAYDRSYPGQLELSTFGSGRTFSFVPRDTSDAAFRLVFETDGSRVTSMRSGLVSEVVGGPPCG